MTQEQNRKLKEMEKTEMEGGGKDVSDMSQSLDSSSSVDTPIPKEEIKMATLPL